MATLNSKHRTKVGFLFIILATGAELLLAQSKAAQCRQNNVVTAEEFLWLTYPDLKDKRYQMTLYIHGSFDYPAEDIGFFRLNVGQYAEGSIVSGKTPGEPSLDEPFLRTMFLFDEQGFIEDVMIAGRRVGNPSAYQKVKDLVESHPEWNETQAVGALQEAGAEFWSDEDGKLKSVLGLEGMEKFLGKITVENETFQTLNRKHVGSFAELYWTISLRATRPDGRQVHYIATFEPFNGQLLGIQTVQY